MIDDGYTIHHGDALDVLRTMPDASVQCVVTSPPYWGLRDYGTALWEGGDATCDHKNLASVPMGTMDSHSPDQPSRQGMLKPYRDVCGKCGARRIDRQLGLEPTPGEYVDKLVAVFREVRRALKDDGTVWLNLGDSYAGPKGNNRGDGAGGGQHRGEQVFGEAIGGMKVPVGLKPKDLCGVPWRVAFALQADGWYLRQDIIWNKNNPMPESVTDRCTKAHEYVFLLGKSARYYYDAAAITEPAAGVTGGASFGKQSQSTDGTGAQSRTYERPDYVTRNRRSVWTIPTCAFPGAHFATFPPALVEPCVKAGCPEGGLVLDPFCGSGTVGEVALLHGRRFVGIELNAAYIELAHRRIGQALHPATWRDNSEAGNHLFAELNHANAL